MIYEIISVLLIISSFFISKYLMLADAIILSLYLFYEKDYSKITSIVFFMLPFSNIFNIGSSSLFLLLKISIILKWLLGLPKIEWNFFRNLTIFVFYTSFSSMFSGTFGDGMIRISNFILWFTTVFILAQNVSSKTFYSVSIHFIYSLIISCVIATFSDLIPGLEDEITNSTIMNAQIFYQRFSGLWNDPNTFSIFMGIGIALSFLLYLEHYISFNKGIILTILLSIFALYSYSKMCLIIVGLIWIGIIVFCNNLTIYKRIGIICGLVISCLIIYYCFPKIIDVYILRLINDQANYFAFDSISTNRSSIWLIYFSSMIEKPSIFIIGNGINCLLPNSRAAHQTILQIIYQVGVCGLLIYLLTIASSVSYMIKHNTSFILKKKTDFMYYLPIGILLFGSLFLDYFYLENFYFLLFLGFLVYNERNIDVRTQSTPTKCDRFGHKY